jgi:hypothetical protein
MDRAVLEAFLIEIITPRTWRHINTTRGVASISRCRAIIRGR